MDRAAPFCLLLLGQPDPAPQVAPGHVRRAGPARRLRYAISGLDAAETASYISHHLALAGRSDTMFSDDAIALIHQVSRGLPRQVNNLAVASLIACFAAGKKIVDESAARQAVTEVSAE